MIHGEKVSKEFRDKVKKICKELGINPNWLMHLMYFESAKTFSPSVRNATSGATGLIQFMPSTARGLGTSTAQLAQMSAVGQLDYVKKYLKQYPVHLAKSYGELYLSVFYPLALKKDDNFILGSQNNTSATVARQNPIFDTDKDGILTKKEVVDYQNKEAKSFGLPSLSADNLDKTDKIVIAIAIVAVLVAVVLYFKL